MPICTMDSSSVEHNVLASCAYTSIADALSWIDTIFFFVFLLVTQRAKGSQDNNNNDVSCSAQNWHLYELKWLYMVRL